MQQFDLIIIGAGPTGLSCAIEAEKAGLHYLVVEKGVLVNSLYHFPTNMTFFSTSKLLEIGDTPFISHSDKPTRMEALEYYRRIAEKWKLHIKLYEEVEALLIQEDQSYLLKTNKTTYHTDSVIVSTGFYDTPRMLNVPGEKLNKVRHYYDDPHPYANQKVLVIGAANSACDVALETYYKGAEVSMAIRESEIYPKVKYWIRPNIINRIKEGSIKAYFDTTVKEIHPTEVVLNTPKGEIVIPNDFVLAMTGYQPNYPLLKRLGIHISNDHYNIPDHHPKSLETNLPNVFVAGVICAGKQTSKLFIENTRDHGSIIIQHLLKKEQTPAA
ncbi:MAG: YpdA family putative bacillithiol disulfide reductase [Saprospiraceae bacterium]|jgi:thioredoxin reductase (NADPH)|nr:YpdA family putative bacillithiol disulfide reductase [Saprospiraceae bacterium]